MTRRWPRRLGVGLVAIAILVTAAVILLWLTRVELVSWTAARLLERQGLGPASFVVDAVGFQGLRAHDVVLAGGALKARTLTLGFRPQELLVGHVVAIEIGGLDATLTLGNDGLALASRTLPTGDVGAGPSLLARFRIDALALKDAHLALVTPDGRYETTLSATIALAGGDLRASGIAASMMVPAAGLSGPVRLDLAGDASMTSGELEAKGLSATITAPLAASGAPLKAVVTADLAAAKGALEARNLKATLTWPVAGLQKPANLTAKTLSLQPQADGSLRILLAQAAATPQDLPWTVEGVDGDFLRQGSKTTAKLSIARLTNRQKPALVAPVKLSGSATLVGPLLDFTLNCETLTKSPAKLQAKGKHDLAKGNGGAAVTLAPIAFKREGPQPGDLFPSLAGMAQDMKGSAGLAGTLAWTVKALTLDLTLTLKDLGLATPLARIEAINGAIKLAALSPPVTPPGQSLTAAILAPGLPPAKLALAGQLLAKPALKLDRVAIDVAGGKIGAAGFTIDPASPDISTILKVDHVDLTEITQLIGPEGLNGTGQLDGQIPITYKGGKLAVSGGKLAARGAGILSYKPGRLPPQIAEAGKWMRLALQALSDFHYDKLTLDLDKAESGEGTVLLHLEGRNPAVMSGHPFNFNIRLESNFDHLADIAMLSLGSAAGLLRRAARRVAP
jgi:hypothetical protein